MRKTDGNNKLATGAIGALDPDTEEADDHADLFYKSVRKMKTDYKSIAKNTGYSEEDILKIKKYLFIDKHVLSDGHMRFKTDFRIAQSWQRMMSGNDIRESDYMLIKHELLEMEYVKQGMNQDEAHKLAAIEHNYFEATEKERGK